MGRSTRTPPASSSSSTSPTHPPPPTRLASHLSQRLEREIEQDDHDFAEFGGDDPHPPGLHHYNGTHDHSPSLKNISSSPTPEDEATAVNSIAEHESKVDIVDWDGPNDPENPQNFSLTKKILSTALIIILTVNVTLASSAPSTATASIAEEFGISSEISILITSLFLVGYVFGPIFWSGLSETYGRRPVFIYTILIYTLFTLGQTLGKNAVTVLITRFWGGLFASAPLTNGGGFIADVWDPIGRGTAVAIFSAAVFVGPIIGPIMGSFVVTSSLGWRWVFWILMIFSGFCWVLCLVFLPETFAPVLLQQKAKRLRKADPIANARKFADLDQQDWTIRGVLDRTIFRPFTMLFLEPILVFITIYLSLVYGLIYALFEVFPIVFGEIHGIKESFVGLTFIGVGIGTTLGALACYAYRKEEYRLLNEKWRGHPPPEERLYVAIAGGPLLVGAIFWLCWSGAYKSVPWYVAEIAAIPLGFGIVAVFIPFQTYIVDTYLMYSSSALAANSMIRSAAGAAFPLFTNQMFHNLGVQWAGTLLGCLALLLAPFPYLFWKYGAWVRTKSRFAPCLDLEIKEELEQEEKGLEV